ncbi:MAG: shikimate kinase [Clostridia bacterium]|nr:shikimate kinase [Clostridia bacterium]
MKNVILVGMPGCGKSTCGVLVAKILCKDFTDTDLLLQNNEKMPLQDIINIKGNDYFALAEEKAICNSNFENMVLATGGSVVYSQNSMEHLKKNALIIYLEISFETMIKRIENIESRGIVLKSGETLEDMYMSRIPLYEKYADVKIDCNNGDIEKTVSQIVSCIK